MWANVGLRSIVTWDIILYQDITLTGKLLKDSPTLVGLHIYTNALLVSVDAEEVAALPGVALTQEGWPPCPGVIPRPRGLDLDNLRPEVGHDHRGEGSSEDPRHVEDLDPFQGAGESLCRGGA